MTYRATYHRFFRNKALAYLTYRIWSNCCRFHRPSLWSLAEPSYMTILSIFWIWPELETISGKRRTVVVRIIDIRKGRNRLLEDTTFVWIELCDRGILYSNRWGSVGERVLIIVRCSLITLRNLSFEQAHIHLSFYDIYFRRTPAGSYVGSRMVGTRTLGCKWVRTCI